MAYATHTIFEGDRLSTPPTLRPAREGSAAARRIVGRREGLIPIGIGCSPIDHHGRRHDAWGQYRVRRFFGRQVAPAHREAPTDAERRDEDYQSGVRDNSLHGVLPGPMRTGDEGDSSPRSRMEFRSSMLPWVDRRTPAQLLNTSLACPYVGVSPASYISCARGSGDD